MQYCITHECPVYGINPPNSECIIVYCPPPVEFDLDGWEWVDNLPAPSEDELILMDMNAEVLEADFQ
jgi:hypothetical protein